jgi:hypothetical protein
MHEAVELRNADQAVVGFDYQQTRRGAHRLFAQRRRDRDVLSLDNFNIGELYDCAPYHSNNSKLYSIELLARDRAARHRRFSIVGIIIKPSHL